MADEVTQNEFSQLLGPFLPEDKFREVTMLLKKVRISILFSILPYVPYNILHSIPANSHCYHSYALMYVADPKL